MPGVPVNLWWLPCAYYQCTRAAGAAGTRHFPAPSISFGRTLHQRLGRIAPRDREVMFLQYTLLQDTGRNGPKSAFWAAFRGSRPCIFAPDPVSLQFFV